MIIARRNGNLLVGGDDDWYSITDATPNKKGGRERIREINYIFYDLE